MTARPLTWPGPPAQARPRLKGLARPTMEMLCQWIFDRLKPGLPEIVAVTIRRPSLGQSCTYRSA